MQISERINFNFKVMDFCLKAINWTHQGNQEDYTSTFTECV